MVAVKICGINDKASAQAASRAGADYAGFVFYPQSPRAVRIDEAAALFRHIDKQVQKVALCVEPSDEFIIHLNKSLQPDILQLHGAEDPKRLAQIIKLVPDCKIWKALGIASSADLHSTSAFYDYADAILLDAKPPANSDIPGGNGKTFDWSILQGFDPPIPWILSGGLDLENIATAIACTGAKIVDISSGVESTRGVKSPQKINSFIKTAKAKINI